MESEWKLQMEKATTQHLIIAQMLNLTVESEELISNYKLSLPALTLDTLPKWEQKLRSFLTHTPVSRKIQTIFDNYKEHADELGVNYYASTSLR